MCCALLLNIKLWSSSGSCTPSAEQLSASSANEFTPPGERPQFYRVRVRFKKSKRCRCDGGLLSSGNMRNFGERAALFQHSACRLGPARRWYKLGLILLISPSVGL